jgi:hypothetical protein
MYRWWSLPPAFFLMCSLDVTETAFGNAGESPNLLGVRLSILMMQGGSFTKSFQLLLPPQ